MATAGYSPDRRRLLGTLYRMPTLLRKPNFDSAVLAEIAALGDPSVIPYLTPILFSKSRRDVLEAARVVDALLDDASPSDLARLDEAMRRSWYWEAEHYLEWRKIEPRELRKWVGPNEPGILLLRLSSFHPNGYVREEATRRLGLLWDGSELPYLLIRLSDWVAQVQSLATVLILERTRLDYSQHFVANLELLYRLNQSKRAGLSDVLAAVSDVLSSEQARPAMIEAMGAQPGAIRRWIFRCLSHLPQPQLEGFLLSALHVDDPVVRLMALRELRQTMPEVQLQKLADSLRADPAGMIRREVLRVLVECFPSASSSSLITALMDRSRAVRDEARYWMKRQGGADFAQFYRDRLEGSAGPSLRIAIAGLGETGGRQDASLLIHYLTDPSTAVRRTTVGAVAALDIDGNVDRLVGMVGDPSPGVSGRAAKAVGHKASRVGAARMWSIYESAESDHVRRNALKLIAATGKWDGIGYLLQAARGGGGEIAGIVRALIRQWVQNYNRRQTPPTSAEIDRIRAALPEAVAAEDRNKNFISFALKGFDNA